MLVLTQLARVTTLRQALSSGYMENPKPNVHPSF